MDIQVNAVPVIHNMVLVWISVIILFFILKRYLYKPVSEFLQKRQNLIQSKLDNAEDMRKEALELKESYEAQVAQVREEGASILESYRQRGEEINRKMIEDTRSEIESIKARTQRELEQQKQFAYAEIKSEAGDMAVILAEKLIKKSLGPELQAELIDGFIDDLEAR
ncbi:MAG: F0F1 ATP synthase subunit B [Tissierellia bacterium]|nr:F0F1 ATP synthase subunit B [Tissierellia bacterium]